MALSAAELAYIRDNTGDNSDVVSALKLSDATLQAIYDDAAQGNSDLDRTVYFTLRRLVGIYAREVDSLTSPQTGFSYAASQRFNNVRKLLDIWGGITGLAVGISVRTSSVNTYRTDSLQTSEPTYDRSSTVDADA